MNDFKCLINKKLKKISYPLQITIEALYSENIGPISLITNELKSGEILIIESSNKKIERIYKTSNNNLIQIYGDPYQYEFVLQLDCVYLGKIKKIKDFLNDFFLKLNLNELINNKNDLESLENELLEYFLLCKNETKIDMRKIRSIIFKNCKNVKLNEKMYSILKNCNFNEFELKNDTIKIDFSSQDVQFEYDS
jgi:hypothetical protein